MSTYKTTCPHCNASFKITKEQLSLRDGRARCGNCSKVFEANKFLTALTSGVVPKTTAPSSASIAEDATPAEMIQSVNNDQVAEDVDALFADDSLKRSVTKTQEFDIPDDALIDDSIEIADEPDTEQAESLGSLGDELTAEFDSTNGNFSAITEAQLNDNPKQKTEEEWIEQLLSEDTSNSDVAYHSRDASSEEQPEDLVSFLEDIGANTAQFSAIQPSQLTQEMTTQADVSSVNLPNARLAPTNKSNAGSMLKGLTSFIFWALLCGLLLATLAGQYLYFNFDKMARDASKHPQLEKICGFVGCDVPFMDSEQISVTQVNRFQDEGNPAWTRMKFVVTNQADQAMLLPNLRVSLKKKGNVVAENIITPKDYLSASYKRLPRSQPIDGDILIKQNLKSFDSYKIQPLY